MNKKFQELQEAINKLAEGQQDNEVLKTLGSTLKKVEELDTEYNELVKAQDDLRKDYIEVVKNSSYKGQNEPNNEPKEVSLEELMMKKVQEKQASK